MPGDGWARLTPALSGIKIVRALSIDSALIPHVSDAIFQLALDYTWEQFGDSVESVVSEALSAVDSWYSKMNIGQIAFFLGSLPPGWLPLDGSTYDQDDFPELAQQLDSQYLSGSQFTLPSIQGSFLLAASNDFALGDTGGAVTHTLTVEEIPSHTHTYTPPVENVDLEAPGAPDILAAGLGAPTTTGSTGSGEPHQNMPPYYTVTLGIFCGRII